MADMDRWRRAHEIVESERDQARESFRRLCAEKDFDLFTVRDQLKQCRGEREQMTRDRDEWKARAEAAERERDEALEQARAASIGWMNAADHAEAAETRTAPAVTKADIEQAVAEWVDDAPEIVNEVWSLVSGDDPAVFVVRESDVAAVARAIEAATVDPVEDKARELHEVAQGDGPFIVWEALTDPERTRFCRMAAHVLGQETGDE